MKSYLGILKPFFYLTVVVELALACLFSPSVALASASRVPQGETLPAVNAGLDTQEPPDSGCSGVALSDVGQAVASAIESSGDPAAPKLSGVSCGSFPVDAATSLIRISGVGGAGDAFQRYTDLIAAAEYEVDFTTIMT